MTADTELAFLKDLIVIFSVSVAVVVALRRVGVPTIAGFILAGVLIGPHALALVGDAHQVEVLAEVGVALLLFGIGLEFNLTRLRRLWKLILIGGAVQVGLAILLTASLASMMGIPAGSGIFLGFLVAVSSTAIVLRGLDARGETEAPHGRFTLGILVFQDLSVVPMMLAIPILSGEVPAGFALAVALGKTFGILAVVLVSAWFLVPRFLHWIAATRQRELFVLTVFLVSMGTAWVVSKAGVSLALGAFLAGLVVAGSDYRHQALADLIPFREVLTSLFFVSVGMLLDSAAILAQPLLVLGLLIAILVGKFAIVFLTGVLLRLAIQVNVIAGLALCQVGEFSFVLLRAADDHNLLSDQLATQFLAVVILSMLVTPLALAAGPKLAAGAGKLKLLNRLLGVPAAADAAADGEEYRDHVLIAGYGVAGQELARVLRDLGIRYVVVDLNPQNVFEARRRGEPAYFGDVTSPDVLEHLGATHAAEVVILVSDPGAAERGVAALKSLAPGVHVTVRSRFLTDVKPLEEAGATHVVPAELEAAVEVAAYILRRHGADPAKIEEELASIRSRKEE